MTSRLEAAGAWDSSSRPLSLLERKSNPIKPTLSPSQALVDGAVGSFADQATDWKSMAAILAGTGAYRLGRMGIMGLGKGNTLRALSVGTGLATEVSAFEGVHRSLQNNPNLWRWDGQNGLKQGLISSLITFGTLKGIGGLTQGENLILRHATQDLGMVLGHQLAYQTGAGPKPQGSWAERLVEAEATNLKIGAAMAMIGKGTGNRNRIFEETISFPKRFFPYVLAAEQPPSREMALDPRWMMMVARGEAKAGGAGEKSETISREAKKEKLIRFAYESLEQWKKDPDSSFDYGKFFLEVETELGKRPLSETQKKKVFRWWEKKVASNEAAIHAFRNYGRNDVERAVRRYIGLAPDTQRQAVSLAHQYPKTFLIHSDNKANMSDFVLCGRGNCSARAKFVLSTGTAANLPLPENLKWAVQHYSEHLETVLYDETAGQIWVFSSGRLRIVDKIDASLYHPAIFLHAFLKHQGITSPVEAKDLLMLEIPQDPNGEPGSFFGGKDPFAFPFTTADFRGGRTYGGHAIQLPGPDFSWTPRSRVLLLLAGAAAAASVLQKKEEENPLLKKRAEALPKPPKLREPEKPKAVSWQESQWTSPVTRLEMLGISLGTSPGSQITFVGFYIMPEGQVILEKPEDVVAFKKLTSTKQQADFFVQTAKNKEAMSDFQKSQAFLSNPLQALHDLSPTELSTIVFYLNKIEWAHATAETQIMRSFPIVDSSEPRPPLKDQLQSTSLAWNTFYHNLKIWKNWANDHPKDFLLLLNELPLEKKRALLGFPLVLEAAQKILRSGKLNPSKTKKEEKPFDPNRGPKPVQSFIELDLSDFPAPPPEAAASPSPQGEPRPEEEVDPEATVIVSQETALVFGLKTGFLDENLLEEWNAESTRTFLKLNEQGRYDPTLLESIERMRKKTGKTWQPSPALNPLLQEIAQRNPKPQAGPMSEQVENLMKNFLKEIGASPWPQYPPPKKMPVKVK